MMKNNKVKRSTRIMFYKQHLIKYLTVESRVDAVGILEIFILGVAISFHSIPVFFPFFQKYFLLSHILFSKIAISFHLSLVRNKRSSISSNGLCESLIIPVILPIAELL